MHRCVVLALWLFCVSAAYCSEPAAAGTSQTCVPTPHWQRLTTIFHSETTELQTCRESLTELSKLLPQASSEVQTVETLDVKETKSLQKVEKAPAIEWWVPVAVGAGAFLVGALVGALVASL